MFMIINHKKFQYNYLMELVNLFKVEEKLVVSLFTAMLEYQDHLLL